MGAKFSRLKVWVKERLKYSDLNGEFDNILNNLTPSGVDGDSSTLGAMRAVTDPAPYSGGVQVESLATNLDGEIQRLRFAIGKLNGGQYWYSDPGRLLTALSDDFIGYLSFDGDTAVEAFSNALEKGLIANAASLGALDIAQTDLNSTAGQFKFNKFSVNLGAGKIVALLGKCINQGSISAHFRNLSAGDYIAYNPLLGIELYLDGGGLLNAKLTKAAAATETSKAVAQVTGASSHSGDINFNHVVLRYQSNGISGAGLDSLGLLLNGLADGAQLLGQTFGCNQGSGGVWFFGAKRQDPAWNHFSAMLVTPDVEAVNAWSATNPGAGSAANGVLSIVNSTNTLYSRTTNVDMSNMTVETKVKFVNNAAVAATEINVMKLEDNILGRTLDLRMSPGFLNVSDGVTNRLFQIAIQSDEFNVIRVVSNGGPNPLISIFINGVLELVFLHSVVTAPAGRKISFGCNTGVASSANFEYFAYHGSSSLGPVLGDSGGQLDDISVHRVSLANAVISQLTNNAAKVVFGKDVSLGLRLPRDLFFSQSSVTSVGASQFMVSDGKTPLVHHLSALVQNPNAVPTNSLTFSSALNDFSNSDAVSLGSILLVNSVIFAGISSKRVIPMGLRVVGFSASESVPGDTLSTAGSISISRGDK